MYNPNKFKVASDSLVKLAGTNSNAGHRDVSRIHSLTHSLTHTLTYLLTDSTIHLLTYSLPHSLTQSINYLLIYLYDKATESSRKTAVSSGKANVSVRNRGNSKLTGENVATENGVSKIIGSAKTSRKRVAASDKVQGSGVNNDIVQQRYSFTDSLTNSLTHSQIVSK